MALLVFFVLACPAPAFAVCDAVRLLARIYNNYSIALTYDGNLQARAAAQLYPVLHSLKPKEFADALEIGDRAPRWIAIHQAAGSLAREIISGVQHAPADLHVHTDNLRWIERVVFESECPLGESSGNASSGRSPAGGADLDGPSPDPKPRKDERSILDIVVPIKLILLIILGLAFLVYRSRSYRIVRLGRMPRHSIDFRFPISHSNGSVADIGQEVSAIDLSLGGMKIKVENVLKAGTTLVLHLPTGDRPASVVWSNSFFAGILFDSNLTAGEFDALMRHGTKTAPAGAEADRISVLTSDA